MRYCFGLILTILFLSSCENQGQQFSDRHDKRLELEQFDAELDDLLVKLVDSDRGIRRLLDTTKIYSGADSTAWEPFIKQRADYRANGRDAVIASYTATRIDLAQFVESRRIPRNFPQFETSIERNIKQMEQHSAELTSLHRDLESMVPKGN